MRPLSPVLAKIAREELNETPERIAQDLIILKEWIKQQPHLKARTNNQLLIAFLRRCRYSLEETKKFIDTYYTHYNLFSEVLGRRFINERIFECNRYGYHLHLEQPKSDNQTNILLLKPARFESEMHSLREIIKFNMILIEIMAVENDHATVAGCCMVVDFTGAEFNFWKAYDTSKNRNLNKKWMKWLQECCPLRTKEIYLLCPQDALYRLLSWKITMFQTSVDYTITVVRSMEELFKYVPQNLLPEEYGGCNGNLKEYTTYIEDLFRTYRQYFDDDINYGTCEQLRSGDVVAFEAEFGANGSFRKLEAD